MFKYRRTWVGEYWFFVEVSVNKLVKSVAHTFCYNWINTVKRHWYMIGNEWNIQSLAYVYVVPSVVSVSNIVKTSSKGKIC